MQAWELSQKSWKQKVRAEGVEGLRHRKGGRPKPRLKPEQVEQLPQLLSQGAEAYGFRGNVWARARVAANGLGSSEA